ncbi:UDP-N-acetylmuramate dehydrogenase [Motiliproteus sediminis]|uniref:UDP-N-acetylmuramate dehydrogenase n=1 Tax=Motiliproteus sediminis TaxID=1468178 RepID=UPI001AEF3963|nr:UDP-N-acetylmuramate dehydrogenase [Motiliproteus sediminis]
MAEPAPHTLTDLNTLRLPSRCAALFEVGSRAQLVDALAAARPFGAPLILGGGSNIVLRGDYPGATVRIITRGIAAQSQDDDWVLVTAEAGEPWHPFVDHCVSQGWYGLENLALIPGTVGAAPIQNIGAYGVEVKDYIDAVEVLDRANGRCYWIDNADCDFSYRDSVFKRGLRDAVVVLAVRFRLRRVAALELGYQGIRDALRQLEQPTARDLFDAVVALRQAKLPDPDQIPNAGSFFKNPVVDLVIYQQLRAQYPQLVAYPDGAGMKLAAGWLIDHAGWKGYVEGAVGVHDRQALVLVHRGGGTGEQLLQLAARIQRDIRQRFGVELEIEPRIY